VSGRGLSAERVTLPCVRRPVIALVLTLVAIAVFVGGLAWLLDTPRPAAGASRGERLYYAYCVTCHGTDGRGSWRAVLFLIRPGDLADAGRMSQHTDQYLADIIKHGGAPLGRPGMPAFGFHLSDDDIAALIGHVRGLAPHQPQRSTSIRSSTSSASR
jgi:mono/diheme cytochrome c family protein